MTAHEQAILTYNAIQQRKRRKKEGEQQADNLAYENYYKIRKRMNLRR